MNYYILRILLLLVFSLIIFLTSKFIFKINLKDIRFISIISVISLAIIILPYDRVFIKFDSIDKLFNYYYPKVDIIKVYEYDEHAYILYKNNDTYTFINLTKDNDKWTLKNSLLNHSQVGVEDNKIIAVNEIKDKGMMAIFILSLNDTMEIEDSINTKFDLIKNDNASCYIGIIEKDYDNNYKIIVDDNEYKIFK